MDSPSSSIKNYPYALLDGELYSSNPFLLH